MIFTRQCNKVWRSLGFVAHTMQGMRWGAKNYCPPTFVPECTDILTEGMVVALEPGVYYEGEFGVRLENNYRITEKGAECLSPYTLEMEDYIL